MDKYTKQLIFDLPIIYHKLKFYPVKVKDYMDFLYLASCLMFEKNSLKDPIMAVKAISMSYLEYLFTISNLKSEDPNENFIFLLDGLLRLVLDKKEGEFRIDYKQDNNGKPIIVIEDEIYTAQDFKEIRELISEQNSLELPDETIQKSVRDKMEEARRFKERHGNSKTASFEEQLLALSIYTGWDLEKIYDMSIRKFIMAIQRANHIIMSNIYLMSAMSGFVTYKDPSILRGWLADLNEDDKYKDVSMDLDSVTDKISGQEAINEKK